LNKQFAADKLDLVKKSRQPKATLDLFLVPKLNSQSLRRESIAVMGKELN